MTRAAVRVLILLATTLGFAVYTGGRLFYLFSLLLVLMLLYGIATCLYAFLGVQIRQRLGESTCPKGGTTELILEAHNRGLFPAAQVSMTYRLPDYGRPCVWTRDFMLMPRGNARFLEPIECRYRGAYTVGVESVTVQDLFGLFQMRRKLREMLPLYIVPRVLETGVAVDRPGEGEKSHATGSEEITVPADVRAYREGDAVKRIHWKLSVRLRELMVRTFEIPDSPMLTLILDLSPPFPDRSRAIVMEDQLVEAAVAMARAFLTANQPVRLVCLGAHRAEAQADSMSGFPALFELFSRLPFDGTAPLAERLASESFEQSEGGVCIATARYSESLASALERAQSARVPVWLLVCEDPGEEPKALLARSGTELLMAREVVE